MWNDKVKCEEYNVSNRKVSNLRDCLVRKFLVTPTDEHFNVKWWMISFIWVMVCKKISNELPNTKFIFQGWFWSSMRRDRFVNAPSHWQTTLHCNVVFFWLGAFTKRALDAWGYRWTYIWMKPQDVAFNILCYLEKTKYAFTIMKLWLLF